MDGTVTRPYIVEALVPWLEEELPYECCAHNGSHRRACGVIRALRRRHSWIDPEESILSEVEVGAWHREAGLLWVRVLVHARIPLAEIAELDGENLIIHVSCGEVFEAKSGTYHVTRHDARVVDGIIALKALQGLDGQEIPDIRAFLVPIILENLEKRILRLMHLETLPGGASDLIHALMSKRYHNTQELLGVDPMDLEDAAEVISERIRAGGHCTQDLHELVEHTGQPKQSDAS